MLILFYVYYSYMTLSKKFRLKMDDYPELNQTLAKILTLLRTTRQLSKKKLAELSGMERVYLIQLEKGEKRPTVNALFLLAKAFGIKASEFVKMIEDELSKQKEK